MDVVFKTETLERLYTEKDFTDGHDRAIVKAYRKKVGFIMAADDERDLRNWKALHYERLKGKRKHQWSIRLNDQWRLILEKEAAKKQVTIVVVDIEDYHD